MADTDCLHNNIRVGAFDAARFRTLQQNLKRLLGSYTNTPQPGLPEARETPAGKDTRGENAGQLLGELIEVLTKVASNTELRNDLGQTRESLQQLTGHLAELRSPFADSYARRDEYDNTPTAVENDRQLSQLWERTAELMEDRTQVWQAFGDSLIMDESKTTTFAGPQAVRLPFPEPCFVITAWNPVETPLRLDENQWRNERLKDMLKTRTEQVLGVIGCSRCGGWQEESYLIAGIAEDEVLRLANQFDQRAIFRLSQRTKDVLDSDGRLRDSRPRCEDGSNRS